MLSALFDIILKHFLKKFKVHLSVEVAKQVFILALKPPNLKNGFNNVSTRPSSRNINYSLFNLQMMSSFLAA